MAESNQTMLERSMRSVFGKMITTKIFHFKFFSIDCKQKLISLLL